MSNSPNKTVGEIRKQAIIEMAARLCREQGLQRLSLRGLAKKVGISAPSIYEYFKNKEELIDTLRDMERNRLAVVLNESIVKSNAERSKLFYLAKTYIKFAMEQPDSFQLLFSLPTGRTSIDSEPDASSPYFPLVITCKVAIDKKKVVSYITDPEKMAFQLWSLMHGIATLRVGTLRETSFEMEPLIDSAINQTLDGLFI